MMSSPTEPTRPLPGWLMTVCSVVVVLHLSLIGVFALSASSGPWPVPPPFDQMTPVSFADGPMFATSVTGNFTIPYYLKPLWMTHNYHFQTNRPAEAAVYFEAHLKDAAGTVTILKFPDDKAVWWVRHRQEVLAQALNQDRRKPPIGTQPVPQKDKQLPTYEVWLPVDRSPMEMKLKTVTDLDLDPMPSHLQPTGWTKAVSESYARHLMREHNAVSVELVRYSRPTVMPSTMLALPNLHLLDQQFRQKIEDTFRETKANFGVYPRE
jgi:hypothetical protein